jgi:hypothetical protein
MLNSNSTTKLQPNPYGIFNIFQMLIISLYHLFLYIHLVVCSVSKFIISSSSFIIDVLEFLNIVCK